jgi:hypothetical protein
MHSSRPPRGGTVPAALPALLRATHLFGLALGSAMGADKGYMWIDYDSNNIGLGAAWVEAQPAPNPTRLLCLDPTNRSDRTPFGNVRSFLRSKENGQADIHI